MEIMQSSAIRDRRIRGTPHGAERRAGNALKGKTRARRRDRERERERERKRERRGNENRQGEKRQE
jgi:hypothetical protein